ncbi:GH116 family glycosyl hydrolase [Paenibacillus lignilyticus]|uniref:Glycosyl-hydrolase family 116 catalytic region domain-containing protein n=1 Tax=Paenibacillus lignilyticus TaxID=1172615 RepID=A0ABS5CAG5_9BACL|nr:hypothetical protein [Paenibacillus lignilyticus]
MSQQTYSQSYSGTRNSHIAYPLGGIGAGMFCLEGTGAMSHFSLRHAPDITHEPIIFSGLCVKGEQGHIARVMEGPVPSWKIYANKAESMNPGSGLFAKHFGLPRFESSSFHARFPFGTVELNDNRLPVEASITGWSPFIPLDADDSSLPAAALEITLINTTDRPVELVYSLHAANFMAFNKSTKQRVYSAKSGKGFVLEQSPAEGKPWEEGSFSAFTDHPNAKVDCAWFRGGWFDSLTMVWNAIKEGRSAEKPEVTEGKPSPGGSLFVPLTLAPHDREVIRIMLSWHVPETKLIEGVEAAKHPDWAGEYHKPWYAGKFATISEVSEYWFRHYDSLRERSLKFSDTFYGTSLPAEAKDAITANLTILKSPTVLRQTDGRMWGWEGQQLKEGSCSGSCTHVWNYAQAVPHLFPDLERSLRVTEFTEGQDERGHQNFRVPLPIQPASHKYHAASDGQLGGIMKAYREWRISGDTEWLRKYWPQIKQSLTYCKELWDPDGIGVLIEPHHNTYDIEFWGPDGMCSSIYIGALKAASLMGEALGDISNGYEELYRKGREYLEQELFNGEYFEQKIIWEGLRAPDPAKLVPQGNDSYKAAETLEGPEAWNVNYSKEAQELLQQEGPKYQYGKGCLSDGVIGAWIAEMCGLGDILDRDKVKSHLLSIYRYNLKRDLSEHANPQRSGFALGQDGGLLLCTWPRGGQLSLPFVYSNEVWTGIEYQVASHLMSIGCVEEGLDIVRVCRDRYDGSIRNPFDEYECGHWYARAMASYGIIQGWSGIRYDAVERALYVSPKVSGDYSSFLCTASGYGIAGIRGGEVFVEVKDGTIEVDEIRLV